MPTYYYLAVSTADNKRTAGKIDAETENAARSELNRMGFSVLGISSQPLAEASAAQVFEFEAVEKMGKTITGTIEADDAIGALDRLMSEFQFTVSYVVAASATDAEKAAAQAAGIQPILAAKAAHEQQQYETQRMSLKGSLGDLMKRAEERMKKQPVNPTDEYQSILAPVERSVQLDTQPAIVREEVMTTGPYPWQRLYVLLNEYILPPAGRTRAEAGAALMDFYQRNVVEQYLQPRHLSMLSGLHIVNEVWHVFRAAVGILALLYFTLFAAAHLAARYTWGGLSSAAEALVAQSTLVPFLALAFLSLYLVGVARDHFASQPNFRATVLLVVTTFALSIIGLNVVY